MWEYSGVKLEPQLQDWMRRAVEEISYNTIQNYMNNRFEFVDIKKELNYVGRERTWKI